MRPEAKAEAEGSVLDGGELDVVAVVDGRPGEEEGDCCEDA